MKISRQKTALFLGIVAVAVTLAVFWVASRWETADRAGLAALLAAEVLLFGGVAAVDRLAGRGGLLLRAGGVSLLAVAGVLSLAVSLLFLLVFRAQLMLFAVVQILLLGACAALLILLLAAGGGVAVRERADAERAAGLRRLADLADGLASKPSNRVFAPRLRELGEALRYSSPGAAPFADREIEEKLRGLESYLGGDGSPAEEEVGGRVEELLWLISRRGQERAEKEVP